MEDDTTIVLHDLTLERKQPDDDGGPPLSLKEIWIGVPGASGGYGPLEEVTPTRWRFRPLIEVAGDVKEVYLAFRDQEGVDLGFLHLDCEAMRLTSKGQHSRSSGGNEDAVMFDSNRALSITWKANLILQPKAPPREARGGTLFDIEGLRQMLSSMPEDHPQRPEALTGLGTLLQNRYDHTGAPADIAESISTLQKAADLVPNDFPQLPIILNNLGNSFLKRFERVESSSDLDKAILVHQRAVDLTSAQHPALPAMLTNLATSFLMRWDLTAQISDIEMGINLQRRAVKLIPQHHSALPSFLWNLGKLLKARFTSNSYVPDLEDVIFTFQQAVELTTDGRPNLPTYLDSLGAALLDRHKLTGNLSNIDDAISNLTRALEITPHGHPATRHRFFDLGNGLLERFRSTRDQSDLEKAIFNHERALQLTPDSDPTFPNTLSALAGALLERFESTGEATDLDNAVTNLQSAVVLTPDDAPVLPARLSNLGRLLRKRANYAQGDVGDIEEAILVYRRAIAMTPEGDPELPRRLNALGDSLWKRFKQTGDSTNLEEAISNHSRSVAITPEGDPKLSARLIALGMLYSDRFDDGGDLADCDDAIAKYKMGVDLASDDESLLPGWLSGLGSLLRERFERTGEAIDSEQAIGFHRKAVDLTPEGDPNLADRLHNLGNVLHARFKVTKDLADIEDALSHCTRAVMLTPQDDPLLRLRVQNLGNLHMNRFQRTGHSSDAQEAIVYYQRATEITPEDHKDLPGLLTNLGILLHERSQSTSSITDIEEAISSHRKALRLAPPDSMDLPGRLGNLARSLQTRLKVCGGDDADLDDVLLSYEEALKSTGDEGRGNSADQLSLLGDLLVNRFKRSGNPSDMEKAVSTLRTAVELTSMGDSNLSERHSALGYSLQRRFDSVDCDLSDIEEAITHHGQAVDLTPRNHPNLPHLINDLGAAFFRRFIHTGEIPNIEEAISSFREAAKLAEAGDPELRLFVGNLGAALSLRFQRTDNLADLEEAIHNQRRSVDLTPDGYIELRSSLNNLGTSLLHRVQYTNSMADIQESISHLQRAISVPSVGGMSLSGILHNLGRSHMARFRHTEDHQDIEEAISAQTRAIDLLPKGHADLTLLLYTLGETHSTKFASPFGSPEDLTRSLSCFRDAAINPHGPRRTRIGAALKWIEAIRQHDQRSPETVGAFDHLLSLVALTAGLEQTVQDRYTHLQDATGIALGAASAAFALQRPDKALEWLEQGRCLVWTQLNNLRSPLDDLREHDAHLAESIAQASKELEALASSREVSGINLPLSQKIMRQDQTRVQLNLAKRWDALISQARALPGFHDFLLPSTAATLMHNLPQQGHIIIINVDEVRCDALYLSAGKTGPLHIPLPEFSLKKAQECSNILKLDLERHQILLRDGFDRLHGDDDTRGIRRVARPTPDLSAVLRGLWNDLVKPIIDIAGITKPDASASGSRLTRLWWCPTGPLSFLPIHAAGVYEGPDAESLFDYAISSYIPTVASLAASMKKAPSDSAGKSGLFLTSQSRAPGALPIPNTVNEVDSIHSKFVAHGVQSLKLHGDAVTIEGCLEHMENFSCVHLACHASQRADDPLASRFLFHNGTLDLKTIIQRNLKDADMAFLSACQTSAGVEKLSDEAVHLAAGMLAAGYRRVVATMWPIGDKEAPQVADSFYDYLLSRREEGSLEFNGDHSAEALHFAVQQLRRSLGDSDRALLSWVPYVHFGY